MSEQNQPSPSSLPSQQEVQNAPEKVRLERVRGWLRSRTGRILVPIMTLLAGMVLGIAGIFLFGESGAGSMIVVPVTSKGNIIVEADKSFVTQLVTKNLNNAGMPGQAQNVTVNFIEGDQIVVSGQDVFTFLGVQVARPFTFAVQPYVSSCVLEIHIVHADISNIPVTNFARGFEDQINQQLASKPGGLPSGFQYCASGVRTEPAGLLITYTAIPD